ncbi:unnamed protein product [Eruca vesicaria subsp. sativa]|uniref:TFIIS central domain-containing protein n=1 Tax=Eruca vesicaria subsp. sativa TaxID=29727 RepID=A0ABC8L7B1_ERUVS|nr:unnamed protein product [Eruca vesicaria subsp. sativa]
MQKQEFLEVFEAVTLVTKTAAREDSKNKNSPAVSRCVDAMVSLRPRPRDQGQSRPVVVNKKKRLEIVSRTDADSNRDKVREILHKSLSKVANEVLEIQERVVSCDSWSVATSVESAMFERLGSFEGPLKAKYRSILFNIGDSRNQDLRRKVLFGEISGERLVSIYGERRDG